MSDLEDESDFISSESSEENDLEMQLNAQRIKNENYLDDTVPQYDNETFFEHFRITRLVVNDIAVRFEESDQYKRHSGQYGKLSASSQVLIFLWFIGHQTSSFRDVADRFNITISSLYRIIRRMVNFLSNLSPQIITWPSDNEKIIKEQHFRENGFPNIIGAIDGCHIKIDKPGEDPDSYINRKGYYSVQMQVVCDHTRKIRDIFVGYPGSVHDSRVFRNSPLCHNLEERCGRYFLLGDSGYPLTKKLLTPFKDRGQLARRQINYNTKLSKVRYVIEHCFGILKQKFRQLYHVKLRDVSDIVHFIRASCVLHNIALNDELILHYFQLLHDVLPAQQDVDLEDDVEDDRDAKRIRDNIVNNLAM